MKNKYVDCLMLMNTALSLRGVQKLPEMGRPVLRDAITTPVNVSLNIKELTIFEDNHLQVEMWALLNQKWVDPRLGANNKTRRMAVAGQIWKPIIVNLIGDSNMCKSEDTVFWRGFGDEGRVLLSEKVKLRLFCTSDFKRFPFDTQECEFKFGSFRFTHEEIELFWDSIPVTISSTMDLNSFMIKNITTYHELDLRCSGNFSSVVMQINMKRRPERYIHCIFLPCVLLILLNYISLWFGLNNRSTRIYLNLCVFASLLYLFYISVCQIQPAPYLKAIDIFVLICEAFATITLLETVFVDVVCCAEEDRFHLKKLACSREYPKMVFWTEFVLKLSYPVFYLFFVTLYGLFYY